MGHIAQLSLWMTASTIVHYKLTDVSVSWVFVFFFSRFLFIFVVVALVVVSCFSEQYVSESFLFLFFLLSFLS